MKNDTSSAILRSYRVIEHVGSQLEALWSELIRELENKPDHEGYSIIINEAEDYEEDDENNYVHRTLGRNFDVALKTKGKKGIAKKEIMLTIQVDLAPKKPEYDDHFYPYLALMTCKLSEGDYWEVNDFPPEEWKDDLWKNNPPGENSSTANGNWRCVSPFGHYAYFEYSIKPLLEIKTTDDIKILVKLALDMAKHTYEHDEN